MSRHIVIIGGGLAGCSAAHTLHSAGYHTTIIEKRDYLGGRVRTLQQENVPVEAGASFFTSGYANSIGFMKQAGLGPKRIPRDSRVRLVLGRKQYPVARIIAGLPWSAKTRLISATIEAVTHRGKSSPMAFWQDKASEQTVQDWAKSQPLLDRLLAPSLDSYLYCAPSEASWAVIPWKLHVLLGKKTFVLEGGLSQFPALAAAGSDVVLGTTVREAVRTPDGTYRIKTGPEGESELAADGVICATTASQVRGLFPQLTPIQRSFFEAVTYSSTVVASYMLPKTTFQTRAIAFTKPLETKLTAITVQAWPKLGKEAVKLYGSGSLAAELARMDDTQVRDQFSTAAAPYIEAGKEYFIQRWPEALPHFNAAHFARLQEFASAQAEYTTEHLAFAGDYLLGPYMEGAFTSGQQAAELMIASFGKPYQSA
jgi:oxygen-dependent protoporphyrinogen oxidase